MNDHEAIDRIAEIVRGGTERFKPTDLFYMIEDVIEQVREGGAV